MVNRSTMLEEAKKDFSAGMNWMDFSNKFFGPGNSFVPKDRTERKDFLASPEYKAVQEMKEKLAEGQPEATMPTEKEYSGAISLRVPKSLHRSLVEEADAEGVSLNQLILAKISVSLYDMTKGRK